MRGAGLVSAFTGWGIEVTVLELGAVVLALVAVALGIRGSRYSWPPYFVSSLLYGGLFWQHDLYGSAALQLVFVAAAVWGWFGWGEEGMQRPRMLPPAQRAVLGSAIVLAWAVLTPALRAVGGAATWLDAFILVTSVAAQIAMVKGYVEAWLLWIVANASGMVHYASQELWFTSLFCTALLFMAIGGLRTWAARHRLVKEAA